MSATALPSRKMMLSRLGSLWLTSSPAMDSGGDCALAISGIAGPGGGTPTKPVGTVCIALAWASPPPPGQLDPTYDTHTLARTFNFPGDREMIRDRSAKMALTMLRFHLLGKDLPF